MPECPVFIVDSFTTKKFAGNPAAVCFLDEELPDAELLKIAKEFNLSETAFPLALDTSAYSKADRLAKCGKFSLRWFTPKVEVILCGHATLAAAHTLFNECGLFI
uniref:Uncharacterized protein n=1 Tax=Ditylenchus dipsaci TaxID=166011 RepID=A0A915D4P5_9BILA